MAQGAAVPVTPLAPPMLDAIPNGLQWRRRPF